MKCPNDQTTLALTHREGVEIDYCPECRGIWLDRGELDKLISLSEKRSETTTNYSPRNEHTYDNRSISRNDDDDDYRHGKQKKRGGMFGDLFDF